MAASNCPPSLSTRRHFREWLQCWVRQSSLDSLEIEGPMPFRVGIFHKGEAVMSKDGRRRAKQRAKGKRKEPSAFQKYYREEHVWSDQEPVIALRKLQEGGNGFCVEEVPIRRTSEWIRRLSRNWTA